MEVNLKVGSGYSFTMGLGMRELFIIILALTSLNSHAKIYSWVDDQGKTHYSDQPINTSSDKTKLIEMGSSTYTLELNNKVLNPPAYRGEYPSRKLYIREVSFFPSIKDPVVVGRYLFGEGCSGADSMLWPEVNLHHNNFFDGKRSFQSAIVDAYRKKGYQAAVFNMNRHMAGYYNSEKNAFFLDVEVTDLNLEACAKSVKVGFSQQDAEAYRSGKFRESAIEMSVLWTLVDTDGGTVEQFTSNGFFDSRIQRGSNSYYVQAHIAEAFENSVLDLLSNGIFTGNLLGEAPRQRVRIIKPESMGPQSEFRFQPKVLIATIVIMIILLLLKRIVVALQN